MCYLAFIPFLTLKMKAAYLIQEGQLTPMPCHFGKTTRQLLDNVHPKTSGRLSDVP